MTTHATMRGEEPETSVCLDCGKQTQFGELCVRCEDDIEAEREDE
jgi:hypothetical protein